MKRFATEIDIAAAPEDVWAILSDAGHSPEWNPTVTVVAAAVRQAAQTA